MTLSHGGGDVHVLSNVEEANQLTGLSQEMAGILSPHFRTAKATAARLAQSEVCAISSLIEYEDMNAL